MATVANGMDEPRKPKSSVPIPRSRRGLKGFLNEVGREMKKVSWPTRAETNRLTGVVLTVCLLIGTVMITMSTFFDFLVKMITTGKA
jgi:preprotein translocase SecE subunit